MIQSFLIAIVAISYASAAPADDPRCAGVQCPLGQKCEVEQIYCYKAPCPPPVAKCVYGDRQNPCKDRQCDPGQVCKNVQVQCFVAPCYPIAECVDASSTPQCGRNEFFDSCTGCENTCENRQMFCPAICRGPGRCRCETGFYRHKNGKCVSEFNCQYGIY